MKLNLYLAIIALSGLAACSEAPKTEIEYVELFSDKTMQQLSDSSFFNHVACISEYEGDIYMSDQKRCQIFRLDSNLNLLRTIGMEGHGPQDFGYIENFAIHQDTIFVGDVTKMRILRFSTDGQFCGAENPDEKIPLNYRVTMDDSHIYYTYAEGIPDKSLVDYRRDSTANKLRRFGQATDFGHPHKNKRQNERHVHRYDNTLIVVPASIPSVEIYDLKGNTLRSEDISVIPVVKEMYLRMTGNRTIAETPNLTYTLFLDSYVHRDRLYILSSVYNNERLDHSSLLEFDLSNGGAEWVRQYDFPDWVVKCCVTDDYIYGFVPQSSSIKRYPLPA